MLLPVAPTGLELATNVCTPTGGCYSACVGSGGLEDVHDTATAMWMTLRKCATRLVSELEERGVCPSPRPGAPANGNAPGNPSTATGAATPAITEPSSEGDEAAAAAQERKRKMKERQAAVMVHPPTPSTGHLQPTLR